MEIQEYGVLPAIKNKRLNGRKHKLEKRIPVIAHHFVITILVLRCFIDVMDGKSWPSLL